MIHFSTLDVSSAVLYAGNSRKLLAVLRILAKVSYVHVWNTGRQRCETVIKFFPDVQSITEFSICDSMELFTRGKAIETM